jgi:16S rRNA (cytidine1402-2'-O)-methyltransferase
MASSDAKPVLYVVDTPIGNLADISRRAERVLREVSLVVAEDTRRSRKLLSHLDTSARLMSFHEHSEEGRPRAILSELREMKEAALVSDAGSPVVSDPGAQLIREVQEEGGEVVPVPGPSAVTAALALSGFPADRYRFAGYPPDGDRGREQWIERLRTETDTVVVFVAPHDVRDLVAELVAKMPDRRVAATNELTKEHESVVHDSVSGLADRMDDMNLKGEWTLVFEPLDEEVQEEEPEDVTDEDLDVILEAGVKMSSGARILSGMRDVTRGEAYDLLQERKEDTSG